MHIDVTAKTLHLARVILIINCFLFQGIDSNSASFLLSIIGITNTVGRVVCGYVADFPWVDALLLNNICLVVSTLAVAATPFCSSYAGYIIMSIFFGIAICKYFMLQVRLLFLCRDHSCWIPSLVRVIWLSG
jgi:predicted MFS family arabinose efflux permease